MLVFLERLGMGYFQMTILIAAGLCFASDAMEVLLLTFLSIVLQAQWGISDADTSILIGSVFIGAMVGTIVLGALGDRIGRKPIFTITAAMICVFGLATALVDSFPALVLVRVMVGFGVGGLTVPL
jgi:MFS family permease